MSKSLTFCFSGVGFFLAPYTEFFCLSLLEVRSHHILMNFSDLTYSYGHVLEKRRHISIAKDSFSHSNSTVG